VRDPLGASCPEHPDRVPELDPDLVHRRRSRAAVVALDDPGARVLHAPLRQDHRRLGVMRAVRTRSSPGLVNRRRREALLAQTVAGIKAAARTPVVSASASAEPWGSAAK